MSESTSTMKETLDEVMADPETESSPTTQDLESATMKLADESALELATEATNEPTKKPKVEVGEGDTGNLASTPKTTPKAGVTETTAPENAIQSPADNGGGAAAWEDTLLQLELVKEMDVEEEEIDIIRAFASGMQPATQESAAEAARAICILCSPLEESIQVAGWLWGVWEIMFTIIQSPDVPSEVIGRLVSILENLRQRARGSVEVDGIDQRLWKDMPLFAEAMETYLANPTTGYMEFTNKAAQAWQNMNTFGALCLGGSIGGTYYEAMAALRWALEEEPCDIQEVMDCRIKAACPWITHSSKPLLRWALENVGYTDVTPDDAGNYVAEGPLYDGPPTMCLQRWGFWIDRFEELGKDGSSGVGDESRKLSLEAATTMRKVEAQLGGHTV